MKEVMYMYFVNKAFKIFPIDVDLDHLYYWDIDENQGRKETILMLKIKKKPVTQNMSIYLWRPIMQYKTLFAILIRISEMYFIAAVWIGDFWVYLSNTEPQGKESELNLYLKK